MYSLQVTYFEVYRASIPCYELLTLALLDVLRAFFVFSIAPNFIANKNNLYFSSKCKLSIFKKYSPNIINLSTFRSYDQILKKSDSRATDRFGKRRDEDNKYSS